jgi:hypothetical protein
VRRLEARGEGDLGFAWAVHETGIALAVTTETDDGRAVPCAFLSISSYHQELCMLGLLHGVQQ